MVIKNKNYLLIIRLEEEIVKVDELCMLRRRETECCIEHCRNLLKPWYVWDNVIYEYDKIMLLYWDRHRDYTLGHQSALKRKLTGTTETQQNTMLLGCFVC